LDPDRILLYAQLVIQVFLIFLVIVLIIRDRKKSIPSQALDNLKQLLDETQKINEEFAAIIQQKAGIVRHLMDELEKRIQDAQNLRSVLGEGRGNNPDAKTYSTGDVLRLSKEGHDALEIARITGIPAGEIQLMIRLAGQEE
jgi:hypothetical protein